MIAYFDHYEQLTADVYSFFFRPEDSFEYLAGQYTEITIPEIEEPRWYTLSSSPSEKYLSITTKYQSRVSDFKKALKKFKQTDYIYISEPIGDFILPKDKDIPIVYVAGGIGITPVRSIVKSLTVEKQKRSIDLIYAVSDERDIIFRDVFRSYNLNFLPIVMQPSNRWHGEVGKVSVKRILEMIKLRPTTMFFVSGPQELVETICQGLEAVVPKNQIIMDYFPGYAEI